MPFTDKHDTVDDQVRVLNPLEIENWDSRLEHFPEANFFHGAAWARVLNSTYGYQPMYFTTGEGNGIRSLLPVMEVDSWLTGRRGISLPFTDECEPLGVDANSIGLLFVNAQIYAKQHAWKYLECRGGMAALEQASASTSFYNHRLQMQPDEAALFARFDSSVRRAVRKAGQSQITIEFSQSSAAISSFYDLLCMTRQRHGVPPQPFHFFSNIHRHILAQNQGWVVLARHGGIPVAGAVFLHSNKSVIYKFGASNAAFQHLRPNNLVMWEAIRRYAREGFSTLDFGRTELTNEGLRQFKLSWGTQERIIDYFRYDTQNNCFLINKNEDNGTLRQLFRSLPRFVSRLVGILLYKHIA